MFPFRNICLDGASLTFLPEKAILGLVFDVGNEGHSLNKMRFRNNIKQLPHLQR